MTRTLLRTLLLALSLVAGTAACAGDVEDGNAAFFRRDYATALRKYKSAAARGDEDAQHNLGTMYVQGKGVVQDYAEAMRWYKLSAAQGNSAAQRAVGLMYLQGQGVVQSNAEAIHWFWLAAEQGEAAAQSNLGYMYSTGYGVAPNIVFAHMWYNLAVANGDTTAVKNRDSTAEQMSIQQIAKAQKMARDCQARNFKNCNALF